MNPENVPLLDRDLLLRRLGGDAEIASLVYRDIAESFPARLDECRHALEERDMEALRRAAHTIKGSAATAAAERAALLASDLNSLAQDSTSATESLAQALEKLEACISDTLANTEV